MNRPTVAVIGAGVSGLTAAHVLAHTHDVTVFEADERPGGHAHTHDVRTADGRLVGVDSGFIVHNRRTYPRLLRLFDELGVATRPTEMSMSITCRSCGLSYAGGRGLAGILAQRRRAADPRFLRLLAEVPRFHRRARALLAGPDSDPTWGEFLEAGGYSAYFVQHFALPLVACVWSSGDGAARGYPARHLFEFLEHHGMLSVSGSPAWRTVVGGSRSYVDALTGRLTSRGARVRLSAPVTGLMRHADAVAVRLGDTVERFDQVVVATHADQALDLLADATPAEKADLASIGYSRNRTVLHRDSSSLPALAAARASWNHRVACQDPIDGDAVHVSYWMNRLMGIDDTRDYVVSLNPGDAVDPAEVIAEMSYSHPVFTSAAVAAAARLRGAGGDRLAFAGAHLGWGFHEDGCRSGVAAAERLGGRW